MQSRAKSVASNLRQPPRLREQTNDNHLQHRDNTLTERCVHALRRQPLCAVSWLLGFGPPFDFEELDRFCDAFERVHSLAGQLIVPSGHEFFYDA